QRSSYLAHEALAPWPAWLGRPRLRTSTVVRLRQTRLLLASDPRLSLLTRKRRLAGLRQRCLATWAGRGPRAVGSGGLDLACCVWVGFGDAAKGDFEAEGAEPSGVVGDLAAEVAPALVVVRAKGSGSACRGWTAVCGRPSAGCSRWRAPS